MLKKSAILACGGALLSAMVLLLACKPRAGSGKTSDKNAGAVRLRDLVAEEQDATIVPRQPEGNSDRSEVWIELLPMQSAETEGLVKKQATTAASAPSRLSALRSTLFAEGVRGLERIERRAEAAAEEKAWPAAAPPVPAHPPAADTLEVASPVLHPPTPPESSLAKPLGVLQSNLAERQSAAPTASSRLERGEPVDGIQILPSRRGQYRRKS